MRATPNAVAMSRSHAELDDEATARCDSIIKRTFPCYEGAARQSSHGSGRSRTLSVAGGSSSRRRRGVASVAQVSSTYTGDGSYLRDYLVSSGALLVAAHPGHARCVLTPLATTWVLGAAFLDLQANEQRYLLEQVVSLLECSPPSAARFRSMVADGGSGCLSHSPRFIAGLWSMLMDVNRCVCVCVCVWYCVSHRVPACATPHALTRLARYAADSSLRLPGSSCGFWYVVVAACAVVTRLLASH